MRRTSRDFLMTATWPGWQAAFHNLSRTTVARPHTTNIHHPRPAPEHHAYSLSERPEPI